MIKVNLGDGKSFETYPEPGNIPQSILMMAKEFWGDDAIFPNFSTTRLSLYNALTDNKNKYVFLKIHKIEKRNKTKNIGVWCKNGQLFDFFNDDLDNKNTDGTYNDCGTTSEIFGLHRNDLTVLKRELFSNWNPDLPKPKPVLNAILYQNQKGINSVWFYLNVPDSSKKNGKLALFIGSIGSSGVKVPKGSA